MNLPPIWQETLSAAESGSDSLDPTISLRSMQVISTPTAPTAEADHPSGSLRHATIDRSGNADYRLEDLLGRGGMGVVYRARQNSLQRDVALKVQQGTHGPRTPQGQHFLAEAALTGELDHPNIVPVYEIGATDRQALFYSMQEVPGRPWRSLLRDGQVAEERHLRILEQVALTVGYAHACGIIHCDLKPANVMVADYGQVFVVDWGLALRNDPDGIHPMAPGGIGGTPAYMAPEQARHDLAAIGPATDIYLLGALLFHICSGHPPHPGTSARACMDAAIANRIRETGAQHDLLPVALQAMASDPARRHVDTTAFLHDLRQHLRHREAHGLLQAADGYAGRNTHDGYSRALVACEEAATLAPDDDRIGEQARAIRHQHANHARDTGDDALVLDLLQSEPDHPLAQAARRRIAERTRQQRRLRLMRRLALSAALLGVTIIGVTWAIAQQGQREADRAQLRAESATDEALAAAARDATATRDVERAQARSALALAKDHLHRGAIAPARELLESIAPNERHWGWRYLHQRTRQDGWFIPTDGLPVRCLAFTDDGEQVAVGSRDGVYWFRLRTGERIRRVPLPEPITWIHPLADGSLLAGGDTLWQVPAEADTATLLHQQHESRIAAGDRAEDGAIVTVAKDQLCLWKDGDIRTHTCDSAITAVHIDAESILTAHGKHGWRRWHRSDLSLQESHTLSVSKRASIHAFTVDGNEAMVSLSDNMRAGAVGRFDLAAGTFTAHGVSIDRLRPAVIDERMWAGFERRHRMVFLHDQELPTAHQMHVDEPHVALALHPREPLAAYSHGTGIGILPAAASAQQQLLADLTSTSAVAPLDHQRVFVGTTTGYVTRVDHLADRAASAGTWEPGELSGRNYNLHTHGALRLMLSPDGQRLLRVHGNELAISDVADREASTDLMRDEEGESLIADAVWHADGQQVWALLRDGQLALFAVTGQHLWRTPMRADVHPFRIQQYDGHIYTAWGDGLIQCHRLPRGDAQINTATALRWERDIGAAIESLLVAAIAGGDPVVLASDEDQLTVLDANTGEPRSAPFPIDSRIRAFALHPEGTRLVSGSKDGTLTLWRTDDWQPLMTWAITEDRIYDLAFAGDRLFAATNNTGTLMLDGFSVPGKAHDTN